MTPLPIAVIDIGKTNAKLVLVDPATGEELAVHKTANRVVNAPPYPHYDLAALERFLFDALSAAAREPGYGAISITTHGAASVVLAEDGTLALPAIDYEFAYPDEVREAYRRIRPPFSETISPLLTGGLNVGAQLHYQKTVFPEDFARVRTVLTYAQYWAYRLTGVLANEVTSLGCHTDLWNPATGDYASLVDTLELRPLLPPIRSAFDALGPVQPALVEAFGIPPVPVYCGIHDSNASLLAHLRDRPSPFSVLSTGTWVVSFAVGGSLTGLDPARDTLANTNAYGDPVPSARFMGGREFEMLTEGIGPVDEAALGPALEAVLSRFAMVLPAVSPGTGPFPDQRSRTVGAFESDAETIVGASLYAALMSEASLSLLAADGPTLVEGPFSRNRIFLRALKGLTGRPVLAVGGQTGTSAGAALLAGAALAGDPPVDVADGLDLGAYRARWYAEQGSQGGE